MLTGAFTSTSPTVSTKQFERNRCFRVEKRVQQCLDFHIALFVTKCLGLHLLLARYPAPRPLSRLLHYSASRTVRDPQPLLPY